MVRKGRPEDAHHFSELVTLTSPAMFPIIFGPSVKKMMEKLFPHKRHYYSFDRSFFAEIDGKVVGMAQMHKLITRKWQTVRLSFLLLKYLKWRLPAKAVNLLKFDRLIKFVAHNDCYISNVAVYPEFRSFGIGTKLLAAIEEEAKSIGKKRIVLHAETHNKRAISLYERLGYKIEFKSPSLKIKNRLFESFAMYKSVTF
ncbi:MAG: GNAT family N-acetyltransferase [Candidatus Omnitrophota bacterium]|jgi:ribosomal protein S18 acetylase RimI-like enzyme|nr:GNAT family N-acetyltransferase [Candidatus Omnitrophota bacterium]